MIKTSALLILLTLRLAYQPSAHQTDPAPFSTNTDHHLEPAAQLLQVSGWNKDRKNILEWEVSENQTADLFEVEKSRDGKNFRLAAIVFGSDIPEKANYRFFEKTGRKKMIYRIKLISKNNNIIYSPEVVITPGA